MAWHRIARIDEIPAGGRKFADLEGHSLALIHNEAGLWCIDFRCPHTGGPLGEGVVQGDEVICPLHKWHFRLDDGTCQRRGSCEPAGVYQLRLDGQDVMVELPQKAG